MKDAQQLESSSRILLAIATLHLEEAHEAKSTVAINDMDFELHCRWSIILAKQLLTDTGASNLGVNRPSTNEIYTT